MNLAAVGVDETVLPYVGAVNTESLSLYPNPGSTNVVLETSFEPVGLMEIMIMDVIGNVVLHTNSNSMQTAISVSSLPAGVYTVRVVNGETLHSIVLSVSR